MSNKTISFEKVLKKAEQSLRDNEELKKELAENLSKRNDELSEIELEKEKIAKEREKIYANARQETKRIVADKLSEAEEIIAELKDILKRTKLESKELFKAGELRNRLRNSKYLTNDDDEPFMLIPVDDKDVVVGNSVYVKTFNANAIITGVKKNKNEIEISIGNIKSLVKKSDLFNAQKVDKPLKKVNIKRQTSHMEKAEINVIGKTSLEAVEEVTNFIDRAIVVGVLEVKIIHGVGEGILLKAIREYLKTNKNVLEYRRGKYGEGENGVTIVTLK